MKTESQRNHKRNVHNKRATISTRTFEFAPKMVLRVRLDAFPAQSRNSQRRPAQAHQGGLQVVCHQYMHCSRVALRLACSQTLLVRANPARPVSLLSGQSVRLYPFEACYCITNADI